MPSCMVLVSMIMMGQRFYSNPYGAGAVVDEEVKSTHPC
jgi:hypothetical protein